MSVVEVIDSVMRPILYERSPVFERFSSGISLVISGVCLVAIAAIVEYLVHFMITKVVPLVVVNTKATWDDHLLESGVFRRFARIISPVLLYVLFPTFVPLAKGSLFEFITRCLLAYLTFMAAHTVAALLDGLNVIYQGAKNDIAKKHPIKGYLQLVKVLVYIVSIILVITDLADVSPLGILGGLGAMSAVLMLVFKDPLLGFVASMQLSANDMVRIGDWIEMPKHNADGSVTDITLQSVVVQNWDNTITTIPIYAMVADSFKNWRGMINSGGRRIKRVIFIDMSSIHPLSTRDISHVSSFKGVAEYIAEKQGEAAADHPPLSVINVSAYLAYVKHYLAQHPRISPHLMQMARYLAPDGHGLPLEIYAFCTETGIVLYEKVQADLYADLLAMLPEFGLRAFQSPSGWDLAATAPTDASTRRTDKARRRVYW
ncbi:MAG: mechanosensitive ion channel family protein [Treponema sp.]|jgi:miniconductance mechanosensitive channel|nr:mechanosensitive ion channel family protein [Treponema sp.]